MNKNTFRNLATSAKNRARAAWGKTAAAGGAMMASGAAFAQDGVGSVIAGELASAKAEMLLVIGAIAICLGVLIVWSLTRKAAGK